MDSDSGDFGATFTKAVVFAFNLEVPHELGMGVGTPMLDRSFLRVFCGSGGSVDVTVRREPGFSSVSGVFEDDGVGFKDRFSRLPRRGGVSTSAESTLVGSFTASTSSSLPRFLVVGVILSFRKAGVRVVRGMVVGSCF